MAKISKGKPQDAPRKRDGLAADSSAEAGERHGGDISEIHDAVAHPPFDSRGRLALTSFGIGLGLAILLYFAMPLLPFSAGLTAMDLRAQELAIRLDEARRTALASGSEADQQLVTSLRSELDQANAELAQLSLPETYWLRLMRRDGGWTRVVGAWIGHLIFALAAGALVYAFRLGRLGVVPGVDVLHRERSGRSRFQDLRRAQLLRHWSQTGSVDAVRAANESLAGMAETRRAYGFVPFQWAGWLQPVLGFLGTVVGVSMSIDSLQFGIRMIFVESTITPAVMDQFNQGFAGLAVAFDTTFFGLAGSALTGTLSMFLRRRALGAMARIDEDAQDFLATRLPALGETDDESQAEHEQRVRRLTQWFEEKARPGLEREFEQGPAFRKWLQEELPKTLRRLGGEQSKELAETIREAARRLASRMGGYGELLVRYSGAQAAETQAVRRIGQFVLQAAYEAGHARPDDPFWQQFVAALERPLRDQPEMDLVQSPAEGRLVEALALSGAPHRLAIANRSTATGETRIVVHALDVPDGDVLEFHTHGRTYADASVLSLAFDNRSRLLAYGLFDGGLGVFDLATGAVSEVTLDGVLVGSSSVAWLGGEVAALACVSKASLEGGCRLHCVRLERPADAEDELDLFAEHSRGALDLRVGAAEVDLGGLEGQCLAGARGRPLVVVAGLQDEQARLRMFRYELGGWRTEVDLEIHGHPGGFRSLVVIGSGEDRLLCGMVNGMVVEVDLASGRVTRSASFGGSGAALVAVEDRSARFLAVGGESGDALTLVDAGNWEALRGVRGHDAFRRACVAGDRTSVAVAGTDGHVAFWRFPDFVVAPESGAEGS